MSKTVSVRLSTVQLAAIDRWRRRFHQRSTSAALQLLLEEKLREEKYGTIAFADTAAGRQAYLAGTGLAIWEVAMVARAYDNDVHRTAEHLELPERLVASALQYAADYSAEIGAELAENDAMDFESLKRILPDLSLTEVPPRASAASDPHT